MSVYTVKNLLFPQFISLIYYLYLNKSRIIPHSFVWFLWVSSLCSCQHYNHPFLTLSILYLRFLRYATDPPEVQKM